MTAGDNSFPKIFVAIDFSQFSDICMKRHLLERHLYEVIISLVRGTGNKLGEGER
jgi:hypothetical protein